MVGVPTVRDTWRKLEACKDLVVAMMNSTMARRNLMARDLVVGEGDESVMNDDGIKIIPLISRGLFYPLLTG